MMLTRAVVFVTSIITIVITVTYIALVHALMTPTLKLGAGTAIVFIAPTRALYDAVTSAMLVQARSVAAIKLRLRTRRRTGLFVAAVKTVALSVASPGDRDAITSYRTRELIAGAPRWIGEESE